VAGRSPRHALARLGYVAVIALATLTGLHFDAISARAAMRCERALRWHVHPERRARRRAERRPLRRLRRRVDRHRAPHAPGRRVWHATRSASCSASAWSSRSASRRAPGERAGRDHQRRGRLRRRADAGRGPCAWPSTRAARATLLAVPLVLVALPYLAACALEAFSPLGALDARARRLGRASDALGGARRASSPDRRGSVRCWWDVPLFGAAGALVAAWLVERRWRPVAAARRSARARRRAVGARRRARGLAGGRPRAARARACASPPRALAGAALVAWRRRAATGCRPGGPPGAARAARRRLALAAYSP
jgi:hypothetical protein